MTIKRNQYKCVNSSSPDRSWPVLFECWPAIKARQPLAELHLYYGFLNWERVAIGRPGQPELIARLKQSIEDLKPLGVVYHDRVSQQELANEFLSAGVWVYPTWMSETSCITAMEAQAAGLRMVTSAIAALNETVGDRGVLLGGTWTDPTYKQLFVDHVVAAMQQEDNSDRLMLQQYAKEHFGLDELAKDWESMFYELIEAKKLNPISPYFPTIPYRGNGDYSGKPKQIVPSRTMSIVERVSTKPVEVTKITETPKPLIKTASYNISENKVGDLPRLNIASATNVFPYDGWINYDRENFEQFFVYLKSMGNSMNIGTENDIKLARFLASGGNVSVQKHDIRRGMTQHIDNSIESIYLGQMIEHLNPIYEIPKFLDECYRILKKDGIIRITTPDLNLLINAYLNKQMNKFTDDQPDFYKTADPSAQLAYIMYGASGPNCTYDHYEGHMFLFTQTSMTDMLIKSKFKDIIFYNEPHKSKDPVMAEQVYDSGISHSIIVEAVK